VINRLAAGAMVIGVGHRLESARVAYVATPLCCSTKKLTKNDTSTGRLLMTDAQDVSITASLATITETCNHVECRQWLVL
jgi:hypothetical protein